MIILSCGFETTYGSLQNGGNIMRCIICGDEDLNIEEILNRPRNRLRLKEKELGLEMESLRNLNEKSSTIKQDPSFYVV